MNYKTNVEHMNDLVRDAHDVTAIAKQFANNVQTRDVERIEDTLKDMELVVTEFRASFTEYMRNAQYDKE